MLLGFILFLTLATIIFFLIPKIISGMVLFRALNSYLLNKKNINMTLLVFSLCVYICCTLCFFYISFMVSADLYALCSMSSLLLLEMWFFKQKTAYKMILCYLFFAFPLSNFIVFEFEIVECDLFASLRRIFHIEYTSIESMFTSCFSFSIFCLVVLMIFMMCFTTMLNNGRFKSTANVFILVVLSVLSVISVSVLPFFTLLR